MRAIAEPDGGAAAAADCCRDDADRESCLKEFGPDAGCDTADGLEDVLGGLPGVDAFASALQIDVGTLLQLLALTRTLFSLASACSSLLPPQEPGPEVVAPGADAPPRTRGLARLLRGVARRLAGALACGGRVTALFRKRRAAAAVASAGGDHVDAASPEEPPRRSSKKEKKSRKRGADKRCRACRRYRRRRRKRRQQLQWLRRGLSWPGRLLCPPLSKAM